MVIGHQFRRDRKSDLWTPNRKPPLQSRINWQHPIVRPADGETKPSLVACYLMNEGGGNQIFDITGNNTGAFQNEPAWGAGQDGPAIEFDGVNDYIQTQLSFGDTVDVPYTIVFAYDAPELVVADVIMGTKQATTNRGFLFTINGFWGGANDNNRMTFWYGGSTADRATFVDVSVDDGKVHQIAGRVNADTSGDIFYDGVLKDTRGTATLGTGARFLELGQSSDAGGGSLSTFFAGKLYYVHIFNRGLLDEEIFQLSWNPFCFIEPLWPNRGALWEAVVAGDNVIPLINAGLMDRGLINGGLID